MRERTRTSSLLLVFVSVCTSTLANAQTPAQTPAPTPQQTPPTTSEELLRDGVRERQAGHDLRALELFTEAYGLSGSPVALAQMAAAEQALGRWLPAELHMRQALAASEHPYVQRNRATLETAYAVITHHVGQLFVTGNVAGARVLIDGELVGTLPLQESLRVLVGTHRLQVQVAGHYEVSRPIDVSATMPVREEVELRPESAPPRTEPVISLPPPTAPIVPPPDPIEYERGPRPVGWALWSGGLALAIGGAVAHGLREAAASQYNMQCVGPRDPRTMCEDLRTQGAIELVLAITGYVSGTGFLVAGTIDSVRLRRRPPRTAFVLPTPFSLSVVGSF